MDNNIKEKLADWVKKTYKQYNTGWTYERSEGNYADCFDDGFESGQSWAAYEIANILGIEVEEPDDPEYEDI